jgi:hypothetical protein
MHAPQGAAGMRGRSDAPPGGSHEHADNPSAYGDADGRRRLETNRDDQRSSQRESDELLDKREVPPPLDAAYLDAGWGRHRHGRSLGPERPLR